MCYLLWLVAVSTSLLLLFSGGSSMASILHHSRSSTIKIHTSSTWYILTLPWISSYNYCCRRRQSTSSLGIGYPNKQCLMSLVNLCIVNYVYASRPQNMCNTGRKRTQINIIICTYKASLAVIRKYLLVVGSRNVFNSIFHALCI